MLEAGRVVLATHGRDKGIYYLVLGSEKERILIADGRRRKLAAPKKKNPGHLLATDTVISMGEVTGNTKLRALLKEIHPERLQEADRAKRGGISECQSRT